MDFKTKQNLHKTKKQIRKFLSNVWYTSVYPIAWALDRIDEIKRKQFEKKVDNLSIQQAGELMSKYVVKELTERPSETFEFYVCESSYYSDERPDTVIDHMIYNFYYAKGKYKVLYNWATDIHHRKQMNDVWLNGVLTRNICDILCKVEGLDVHWEYETDLTDPWKTWQPIKDYQKHLVIRVKDQ